MPVERHFLPEHGLVVTRVYGSLTDAELTAHVHTLTAELRSAPATPRELADCTALTDVRGLSGRGVLSAARLEEVREAGARGQLAIVVTDSLIYGLARMYQAIAEQFRREVRVFRDRDEAIRWLGLGPHAERIHDVAEGRG